MCFVKLCQIALEDTKIYKVYIGMHTIGHASWVALLGYVL